MPTVRHPNLAITTKQKGVSLFILIVYVFLGISAICGLISSSIFVFLTFEIYFKTRFNNRKYINLIWTGVIFGIFYGIVIECIIYFCFPHIFDLWTGREVGAAFGAILNPGVVLIFLAGSTATGILAARFYENREKPLISER